ncbi:MAG: hypothetical protein LIO79_09720 [Rikenellaceae bacterium]|nr:hypothetical protein [Rikenellaceae bacterium]
MAEISEETMLKAFIDFDPIQLKYQLPMQNEMDPDEAARLRKRYADIIDFEQSGQFEMLTKRDYAGDYANLRLIYDEEDDRNQRYLQIIELILDKVICQYINIDGMERLFSETYIEFEWEMHLSADYRKHNMKYYRDHFVHQIRDAYMMYVFMEKYDFYRYVKEVLENDGESKVSRFVSKNLARQRFTEDPKVLKLHEGDDDFYIRNVCYMSCFMAALFHDIGYPEEYYLTTGRHIRDYIAGLRELNASVEDVNRLYSLLQNSLLFRVVPFSEIEKRISYAGPADQGPEHGALSAVIFLLHFYENGAIHTLAPYKKTAVELAALAIYNHTNRYGCVTGGTDYTYYRPSFSLNPISYMLRICDDLQEWDRVYFVISKKTALWFCERCKTPILDDEREMTGGTRRSCYCNTAYNAAFDKAGSGTISRAFDKRAGFLVRRIYNVCTCDSLTITENEDKRKLLVSLHYSPYKLLHVAYLGQEFMKYRISELNAMKPFFECQTGIPSIYLDYFVSSNPILIKIQILDAFLEIQEKQRQTGCFDVLEDWCKVACADWDSGKESELKDAFKKCFDNFKILANDILDQYREEVKRGSRLTFDKVNRESLFCYQEICMDFYIALCVYQRINKKRLVKENKKFEEFLFSEEKAFADSYSEFTELHRLILDCFLQFTRMYENIMEYDYFPERYYKQFDNSGLDDIFPGCGSSETAGGSDEYYETVVSRYLDGTFRPKIFDKYSYDNQYEKIREDKDNKYIDAFTDLYLFRLMDEKTADARQKGLENR